MTLLTEKELVGLKVAELKEICKKKKIAVPGGTLKADIINLILDSQKKVKEVTEEEMCIICCEEYVPEAFIDCAKCSNKTCKSCVQRYILESIEPKCMHCGIAFTNKFLIQTMGRKWFDGNQDGQFRKHRKDVALEREKSMLPESMIDAERKRRIVKFDQERKALIDELTKTRDRLREELRAVMDALIQARRSHLFGIVQEQEPEEVQHYICPCPVAECRGMINSSSFKCAICTTSICRKCREPLLVKTDKKSKKHVCNQDAINNLELIRKDTKPCPKCAVPIFKIDGCFDPNTLIRTFDGRVVSASDIKVGDVLLGDDGTERTVEEVRTGIDQMYEIQQDKADNYTVSSHHKLVVKHYGEVQEILVVDYLKLDSSVQANMFGYRTDNTTTPIKVVPVGSGRYIGWRVSGNNKRFVLNDLTVVRNCDQMWCTMCKVAFSWRTGKIETGHVHNPHALEWRRQNGGLARDVADVPCGGLIDEEHLLQPLGAIYFNDPDDDVWHTKYVLKKKRVCTRKLFTIYHYVNETIAYIQQLQTNNKLSSLRVDYILGNITEEKWKQAIFVAERKTERNLATRMILEVLRDTMIDLFRDLVEKLREHIKRGPKLNGNLYKKEADKILVAFYNEADRIREFVNASFEEELSIIGSTKYIQILPHWRNRPQIDPHGDNDYTENKNNE